MQSLAVAITELKAADEPNVAAIASIEDFDRAFAPYERMMKEFLAKAQDGTFASIGLVPTATPLLAEPMDEDDFKIDFDSMQQDRE